MGKAVKMPEKTFSYIPASVCGALQSNLSLGNQGTQSVCGCQSHVTEMACFDSLTLIQ